MRRFMEPLRHSVNFSKCNIYLSSEQFQVVSSPSSIFILCWNAIRVLLHLWRVIRSSFFYTFWIIRNCSGYCLLFTLNLCLCCLLHRSVGGNALFDSKRSQNNKMFMLFYAYFDEIYLVLYSAVLSKKSNGNMLFSKWNAWTMSYSYWYLYSIASVFTYFPYVDCATIRHANKKYFQFHSTTSFRGTRYINSVYNMKNQLFVCFLFLQFDYHFVCWMLLPTTFR